MPFLVNIDTEKKMFSHVVTTQVGFELSCKDFQSCALPDTVGSDESKDLAWARRR